jgi:hypothetical protein
LLLFGKSGHQLVHEALVGQRAGVDPFVTRVDSSKFNYKLYEFNIELRRSNMTDLEISGLQHTSSISKDAAMNAGFYTGVLGMRLVYRSVNFDDPSMYHLAYADGASSTVQGEGPTREEPAAARQLGRRVAEKAALLVGGRAHV